MARSSIPWRLTALFMLFLFSATKPADAQNNYGSYGSYQQFYDELSPYGEWIDDPEYGYVWIPDAGNNFRPYYTNGYWANTEYGNTWVSHYKWGWAPFHYGRWTYNNYYGWVWVPGNVWGPAWVSWRSGGGSYGWAPLGPGISVNLSFGNSYYVPDYWWTFTPQQYILSPGFHQHCYGPRYNTNYIHQTTIINNTYVYNNHTYITGPRRNELERATGRPVKQLVISNNARPEITRLRGDRLSIYRPDISESHATITERPREVRRAEHRIGAAASEITTPTDRNVSRQPARDRDEVIRQDRLPLQTTDRRPVINSNEMQQTRVAPREDQAPAAWTDRQPSQPTRAMDVPQTRPQQQDLSNSNRFPERTPMQQPQRIEQTPINRNMESPRVQQAAPQQRIDRPVVEQRQPAMQQQPTIESRRTEAPRETPQRQAPATQPTQDRPGAAGDGGRPIRQ